MTRRTTWTSLIGFVTLAYGITWLAWLPGLLQHRSIFAISLPLTLLGGMGPALAAVAVTAVTEGTDGLRWLGGRLVQWRVPFRWYLAALLLPLLLMTAAMAAKSAFTGTAAGFVLPAHEGIVSLALVLGATFLTQMLLTGGNEELGWRGYLLPALQARWSSLTSSVVLGVIWALWHLPLFFMAGTSQSYMPFPGFLLFTIPLTVIFTWVHNQTGGSILLVMLLHGAVNTTLGLVRITVMDGWACAAWLVLAVLVTVLPGRGRSVRREPARRANKTDTVA
jgi:membrane protease YdiL (CAAX protease family)